MITLIAVIGFLVLAGGGAGIAWAVTTFATAAPASDPIVVVAETKTPTASPTPTPEEDVSDTESAPPAAAPAAPVVPQIEVKEFKSPSGNIRCSIGNYDGGPAALCQQPNINYAYPAGACSAGSPGVTVGVHADGPAYWPCLPNEIIPPAVQPLDVPFTHAGITCVINQVTGVTCRNPSGAGFTMEYDKGVQLF